MSARILIVDDNSTLSHFYGSALEKEGHTVRRAFTVAEGMQALKGEPTDVLILDLELPDGFGIQILQNLQQRFVDPPATLIVTGHSSAPSAVQAMHLHAFDYMEKPVRIADMRRKVRQALASRRVTREIRDESPDSPLVIGESAPFQETIKMVERVAPTSASIFISGESGSGKEVIARLIHERSRRARTGAYVPVNCASIPSELVEAELFGAEAGAFTDARRARAGQIEAAHRGTLFLDEIDQLGLDAQGKLLRVLNDQRLKRLGSTEERQVDFRLICATNANLAERVKEKRFREDLYFRIHVIEIRVPPLRDRRGDLPDFIAHFIKEYNSRNQKEIQGVEPAVMAIFQQYAWPGNVRELQNVLERAVILADGPLIALGHLPPKLQKLAPALKRLPQPPRPAQPPREAEPVVGDLKANLAALEQRMLKAALSKSNGNQTQAARALNVSRDVLRYTMKKYEIDPREYIDD